MDTQEPTLLKIIGILATVILAVMLLINFSTKDKVYNCELAEISPDFPIKVKEACRQLRMIK